ncbi:hypothetical protein O6H91_03G010300 [Diphasiastrum complanatum]|uniref:Uncharacterized protein n=2 Tax=Diphasiastrum complanatum TaxID=34168 RepID=A0ACC2E3L3_DIPCM|nr:hypothetical protein O6H91_03G009500 [Diphasiastrum complanatum]KAJ7561008.1 hypothetical protein O6H91_03G010300 [Diphasiastrum complanatum]
MPNQLDLLQGVKVHPVFHISRLKERLGGKNDFILHEDLVELEDLTSFVPTIPQAFVDVRQQAQKTTTEYLVRWKRSFEDDDTWKKEPDLKQFPDDKEFFKKKEMLRTQLPWDMKDFSSITTAILISHKDCKTIHIRHLQHQKHEENQADNPSLHNSLLQPRSLLLETSMCKLTREKGP